MGTYPTFCASNKITVEQAKKHVRWKLVAQYGNVPDYEELLKFEDEFSVLIKGNVACFSDVQIKRAVNDFLWLDEQVITPELVDAVRAVLKLLDYGAPLVSFFESHVGWVVWWWPE